MDKRSVTKMMLAVSMLASTSITAPALAKNGGASRSRMIAEVETDAGIAGCKYMAKGDRYRLVFFAEGFNDGDVFDVSLNGRYAGSMTVAFDPVDQVLAAELDLVSRGGDLAGWAPGIPLQVSEGATCTLLNKNSGEIHSVNLATK